MSGQPDEDLFAESTMTFGEHLDELRVCLIKALIGLLIGFCIGLAVGDSVVAFVKLPLEQGLRSFYENRAVTDYALFAEQQKAMGKPAPYSLAKVEDLINNQGFIYTKYLVHPEAVRTQLGIDDPSAEGVGESNDPGEGSSQKGDETKQNQEEKVVSSAGQLVPLFVWNKVTNDRRVSITALNAQEAFMIWLKASLVAGFVFASPWIFYQAWLFVAAGLYPHEKKYVHIFLPFSVGLFLTGALFCFFIVFPFILDFLFKFNATLKIDPDPRISEWLSFAIFLPVGFGISFQLPLVMLFLDRIGVFNVKIYLAKWRIAILIIFVLSMLLTPADPMSMLAMALPLTALYFGGIALCHYMPARKGILEK